MALSDAQLNTLAGKLFLLQHPNRTGLWKPTNTTGADSLAARLDPIGNDPNFKDFGIGVVDFTKNKLAPKIWLHNGDDAWRTGSTGKISILLAAVQLRDDVRLIQDTKFISTPQEFDELFASPALWSRAPDPVTRQLANNHRPPRISTIFDFTKPQVDFFGPDPDTPDATDIVRRLQAGGEKHLQWADAKNFDFSERLWLAGAKSDNRAATSCISEIGVAYLRAVQRAYRLFDPKNGMHLQLAGLYGDFDDNALVSNRSSTIKFRSLLDTQSNFVKDAMWASRPKVYDDQYSYQPGSAAALTAYMVALFRDELVALDHGFEQGKIACDTIRNNLSHGLTTRSNLAVGVGLITHIKKQITKIGLLDVTAKEPGALNCEFAYMETEEATPAAKKMQYGVVVMGIRSKNRTNPPSAAGGSAVSLTQNLGIQIHRALLAP